MLLWGFIILGRIEARSLTRGGMSGSIQDNGVARCHVVMQLGNERRVFGVFEVKVV